MGVISTLMLIEVNNVKRQEKKRCKYCLGTGNFILYIMILDLFFKAVLKPVCVYLIIGYLPCARCSASGVCLSIDPITRPRASNQLMQVATTKRCLNCSGAGKVRCLHSI